MTKKGAVLEGKESIQCKVLPDIHWYEPVSVSTGSGCMLHKDHSFFIPFSILSGQLG